MGSDGGEPISVVVGDHFWQAADAAQAVTLTDKLIGLEVCDRRFDGATEQRCLVVPPEQVPGLVRALVRWCATGAVAIAAGKDQ